MSSASLAFGLLLAMLGTFSIMAPLFSGVTVTVMIGMLMFIGGIVQGVFAIQSKAFGQGLVRFLVGARSVLAGIVVLRSPLDYDAFVAEVSDSDRKWMIIAKNPEHPELILDADAFCRSVMRESEQVDPLLFCKKPLIIRDTGYTLGQVLLDLKKAPSEITKEIVLVWNPSERRIITGSDLLGLLFKGV